MMGHQFSLLLFWIYSVYYTPKIKPEFTENKTTLITFSTARYDIASNSWRFEADLPNPITGFKLIQVDGRPAIVGRFDHRHPDCCNYKWQKY